MLMDVVGSTSLVWSHEHQVAHHMDPNVLGKDNDCEIGNPHVRFHPSIERKWWHKYNHIVTISAMSIGLIKWYVAEGRGPSPHVALQPNSTPCGRGVVWCGVWQVFV
jgi:hypothetical protein